MILIYNPFQSIRGINLERKSPNIGGNARKALNKFTFLQDKEISRNSPQGPGVSLPKIELN